MQYIEQNMYSYTHLGVFLNTNCTVNALYFKYIYLDTHTHRNPNLVVCFYYHVPVIFPPLRQ